MYANQTGVLPLVCVCCEQVVGVINALALYRMIDDGDVYICDACTETMGDDKQMEGYMAQLSTDVHYLHLVNDAICAAHAE